MDLQCNWVSAPRDSAVFVSNQPNWGSHIVGPMAEVLLVHWGDVRPFELQLLAHILEEGIVRGASRRMCWRWFHMATDTPLPQSPLCVVQQDVGRQLDAAVAQQVAERTGPTVLIGPAATWFAASPQARGRRVAIHWEDAASREHLADDVIPSPAIIEVSGQWTTCAGGFAVVDLGLLILSELAGSSVVLQVMDALCMDRLREPGSRQRTAASQALGTLVPKLVEAITLMEANVEEPLQTDEIARLVSMSRRQLERLFKQHLSTVPSRYYLDIRLQRARKLLRETRHSLLQVALMCGFSSGSHFSTTYSSVFGVAPREERQRVLATIAR
jgi:AraC family transcriptional regulator, L-arginine-responsive activator